MSNLDYQDGLGDILQQKSSSSHKLSKILTISFIVIVVITLVILLSLSLIKWAFTKKEPDLSQAMATQTSDFDEDQFAQDKQPSAHILAIAPSVNHQVSAPILTPKQPEPNQTLKPTQKKRPEVAVSTKTKQKSAPIIKKEPETIKFMVIASVKNTLDEAKKELKKLNDQSIEGFISSSPQTGEFFIQAGAFQSEANANHLVKQLHTKGIQAVIVSKKK